MRLNILIFFCCFLAFGVLRAQDSSLLDLQKEESYILSYLAADSMKGRSAYSTENLHATKFIARYFEAIGLIPFQDSGFLQQFNRNPSDTSLALFNVIGYLPGRAKPEEYIIISAHFDHLSPDRRFRKDSIFNGANDNASGTAAMMAIARYYAQKGNNERSLVFCAFNAEELGLIGSNYFVEHTDASKIIAGINLEMLGFPQFGKNRLMMTGMQKSGLGSIVRKNLAGSGIKFLPERQDDLFARSDNFPFALAGIPAHSFLCSNDNDRCYHKVCDDLKRIDLPNLALLTKAIIQGISSVVNGVETPSRIKWK